MLLRRLIPLFLIVWTLPATTAIASLNLPQKARLSVNAGATEVFGTSVAIDGDTAVVGAPGAQVGAIPTPGAVFVYTRDSAGVWNLQTALVASDGAFLDFFGFSVALQGDTLLVGAAQAGGPASARQGAVYVFTRTNGTWSETSKLTTGLGGAMGDGFGRSVAFDGDTAVVSAPNYLAGTGAAWIFTRSGGTWTIGPQLLANDPDTAQFFGYSAAISGDTVLIGSPVTLLSGVAQGAAYVFTRGNGSWPKQTKLMQPASATPSRLFGSSVALQQNTALIGADCQCADAAGAAFAYTRTGTLWQHQATIRPSGSVNGDQFGASVSLATPYALIGAPFGPSGDATSTGEAHLFSRAGSTWTEQATVHGSDSAANDQFGSAVALGRSVGLELTALVGAAAHNTPHGAAYIFSNLPPTLSLVLDQTTPEDTTLRVPFTIGDGESPVDSLGLQASSSDPVVAGITFEGAGTNRTLVITPAANLSGQATIDVSVNDENFTAERTFHLTVTPVDDPPTMTAIADQTTTAGTPTAAIPFTIDDIDTPVDALVVWVVASNPDLVPPASGVHLGGTGAARTITISPAAFAHGTSTITVHVDDATSSVSRTFTLTVPDPVRTYYLAEGSTGAFFDTDLLLANPNNTPAPITITYFKEGGSRVLDNRTLAPLSRTTIHVDDVAGMEATSFSTAVASPTGLPLIVERTMRWDKSGYGAHGERATEGAATQWYFAEGSQGFFSTFFLLVNPQTTGNTAHITYFREGEAPLLPDVPLPPESRVTVYAGADAELKDRSFGALVAYDQPGTAERAMYFGTNPLWSGGSDSVGVTAPSTSWYLAEGATGSFFNTFVLLANPGTVDATATLTYLPDTGTPVIKQRVVSAGQRVTINIATEDASLESAAVSTRVESTQPILVERSQYWPAPNWYESHNSFGLTSTATRWGLAEGRVGGASAYQTYILLANPGTQAADVTVRFLRTTGLPLVKTFTVPPARRFNIAITGGGGGDVPELIEAEFGAVIESSQPIAVERAMYSNANGVVWAAGTNATATPLP